MSGEGLSGVFWELLEVGLKCGGWGGKKFRQGIGKGCGRLWRRSEGGVIHGWHVKEQEHTYRDAKDGDEGSADKPPGPTGLAFGFEVAFAGGEHKLLKLAPCSSATIDSSSALKSGRLRPPVVASKVCA